MTQQGHPPQPAGYGPPPGYAPYPPAPVGVPGVPPPPSNAGWAVATLLFFWPLAFTTFNHLHSIHPRWAMGDHDGAAYASERVKKLGKISLGILLAFLACVVVLYVVVIVSVLSSVGGAGYR